MSSFLHNVSASSFNRFSLHISDPALKSIALGVVFDISQLIQWDGFCTARKYIFEGGHIWSKFDLGKVSGGWSGGG